MMINDRNMSNSAFSLSCRYTHTHTYSELSVHRMIDSVNSQGEFSN